MHGACPQVQTLQRPTMILSQVCFVTPLSSWCFPFFSFLIGQGMESASLIIIIFCTILFLQKEYPQSCLCRHSERNLPCPLLPKFSLPNHFLFVLSQMQDSFCPSSSFYTQGLISSLVCLASSCSSLGQ